MASAVRPELQHWAELFHDPSEATLQRLASEDEIMASTIQKLEALSADPESRRWAELRREGRIFDRLIRERERAEGREEGREEGRIEGREGLRRTARRLLAMGLDRASILVATELSEAELDELAREHGA